MLPGMATPMLAAGTRKLLAKWNALDKGSEYTLSNSDLTATSAADGSPQGIRATIPKSSGNSFFTISIGALGNNMGVGLGSSAVSLTTRISSSSQGWAYLNDGRIQNSNATIVTVDAWGAGDVIGSSYDGTNIRFFLNGVLKATVSASGSLYPMMHGQQNGSGSIKAIGTIDPNAASPSGYSFSPWAL